jgi:prefoldin subunit 5
VGWGSVLNQKNQQRAVSGVFRALKGFLKMNNKGATIMETIFISVIVGSFCLLGITHFLKPTETQQTENIEQTKREINELEKEVEAFAGVGEQISHLKAEVKRAWETLDHVQNLAENGENFMKANQREIENLKHSLKVGDRDIESELNALQQQISKLKLQKPENPKIPQPLLVKQQVGDMVLVELFRRKNKANSSLIKFSRWIPLEEYRKKYKHRHKKKTKKSNYTPAVAQQ